MDSEELSLSWSNHRDVLISVFDDLLSNNSLVDCTLAAEGQCLKAHKVVLSASSPYFQLMFSQDSEKHPIVFLKGVKFNELKAIVDFVYRGEVKIKESQLGEFLEVANSLQIRGLNGIMKNAECQRMILPNSPPKRKRKNSQPLFPEDVACDSTELPLNYDPSNNFDQSSHQDSFPNFSFESSPVARSSSLESCNLPPNVESEFPNVGSIVKLEPDFEVTEKNEFVDGSNANDAVEMNNCGEPSQDVIKSTNQEAQYGQTTEAENPPFKLLPEKSRSIYEKEFETFQRWREGRKEGYINEDVLIAYFHIKAKVVKASSLWSYYSMLKATLRVKENIDISKFCNLTAFLKQCNTKCKPSETKSFKKKDFTRFLIEASDKEYLLLKVAMVLGVAGGCRIEELHNLTVDNVEDRISVIVVKIPPTKTHKGRAFTIVEEKGVNTLQIIRKYLALRPCEIDHKKFFISYREGKCAVQPVGKNSVGKMPMLIAKFLKLPNVELYTGHCFRRSSASLLADSSGEF